MTPAILVFSAAGRATAARIAALTGGTLHDADARAALARLFRAGTPIVGVCAAGILIRLLAPLLADKQVEPPVIAVSTDGAHIVPLLGGHHGANRLARELAEGLGGTAALTTASDMRFRVPLDEPPPGYRLADPAAAKPAMAALLDGAAIRLEGRAPWLAAAGYPISPQGQVEVTVTNRSVTAPTLVYNPVDLVAGVGCERGTSAEEIIALVTRTLAVDNLTSRSLAALASIELKADEPGLTGAAAHFGVPLRLFTAAELASERGRVPNPSAAVEAETGTPSVAEAAALKAGKLLVQKHKSARATCAIGVGSAPVDVERLGRAPGLLHIVGIGPGDVANRTASAVSALTGSADWVGYGLYLDLIADLRDAQTEHRFGLGDEEPRVRHAMELAATGRTVALVCSGDAQIYAMAALAFELLDASADRALSPPARRIGIVTHPGISAFQAASAAAGALIGHDFCAISLSDLLTPRETILKRLEAAATGDFVTALYNPRSQRRTDLIEMATALFSAHRQPQTPVILARNLGRADQRVETLTLATFDPEAVDMLTIVLIGASTSRSFMRGSGETVAYTPRGYARKAGRAG
jgi:cobalt-precorrin 5A hydrolase/precorrin-3B C17-methyltransferase